MSDLDFNRLAQILDGFCRFSLIFEKLVFDLFRERRGKRFLPENFGYFDEAFFRFLIDRRVAFADER